MRILLVCFSVFLLIMLIWLFQPAEDILEEEHKIPKIEQNTAETADQEENDADTLRYEAMTAEYENVEKLRRNLKRRLARLKMVLWDQKLPKQEAEEIQLELRNAYAILKNPKLLGAFHNLDSLKQESSKLQYAMEKVQQAIDRLSEVKEQGL